VTRALKSAREELQRTVRRHLQARLALPPSQIDSLAAMVVSGLDLTLSGALGRTR
jgi:hypothetical protein